MRNAADNVQSMEPHATSVYDWLFGDTCRMLVVDPAPLCICDYNIAEHMLDATKALMRRQV